MLLRLFLIFSLSKSCFAGRILFTTMAQGKSHVGSLLPFANALASNGHEVGIYLEVSKKLDIPPQIRDYTIQISDSSKDNQPMIQRMIWSFKWYHPLMLLGPWSIGISAHKTVIQKQPNDFWKVANESWDLILTDTIFCINGIDMSLLKRAPYAGVSTSFLMHHTARKRSLGKSYATSLPFNTHLNLGRWDVEKFFHRLYSVAYYISMDFLVEILEQIIKYSIVNSGFSFQSWIDRNQFSFHESFHDAFVPSPISTQVLGVGGHCSGPKVLSGELEEFVNDGESKGTVLIAFGTAVQWKFAPDVAKQAMIDAVNELTEYRVIWAYSGLLDVRSHVKLIPWVPQKEILSHEKTVLFVSHGGLKSVKESLCAQVPLLTMPMFGEQTANAWLAEKLGFAEVMHKGRLTKQYVLEKMRKMLENNANYKQDVRKAKAQWLDRIIPALDEGVHVVEKIIKHRGLPLEKYYRIKQKQCFVQYLLFDFLFLYFGMFYFLFKIMQ